MKKVPGKRWSIAQNKRYGEFLLRQLLLKKIQNERLPHKFFSKMSVAIKRKKTSEQCRSHHQKMIKTHGSIEGILVSLNMLKLEQSSRETQEKIHFSQDLEVGG